MLAACVAVLILCIVLVVLATALSRPKQTPAPEPADFGQSAGAWQKNEQGWYFNNLNQPIPTAVQKGMDVSKFQGNINWPKAQEAGVEFAIIRCGYGNEWNGEGEYKQDDACWKANADACTALGIPFGTYLYSYATTEEDARSEADHVARLLGLCPAKFEGQADYTAAPYRLSLPVYYDLEDKSITGLYPDEMARLVWAFFDQLESYGYTGEEGIYASLNWVRARFADSAYDPWRENLWIARFSDSLGYTGTYSLWQSTYQALGEEYGVESEMVDLDFRMRELRLIGAEGSANDVRFSNDTKTHELWLAKKGTKAALALEFPGEAQELHFATSDPKVAQVDKHGVVKAKGEGQCTLTVTLMDGTQSVECTVRVGKVTVPIFATGALRGVTADLDQVAALKAGAQDAILLDAGGSLQGTTQASLTGGSDMMSAFAACGYDLQVIDGSDLAYGTARLRSDAGMASGWTVASNLLTAESGLPLLERATCWNRNRISNGQNLLIRRAGRTIGFFALSSLEGIGNVPALTEGAAEEIAAAQVAALQAQGAEAILCVVGADTDPAPLLDLLAKLKVTAVVSGKLTSAPGGKLPMLAVGGGLDGVGKLELTFRPDGTVSVDTERISRETLAQPEDSEEVLTAQMVAAVSLADLENDDAEIYSRELFTMAWPEEPEASKSFGNYVAEVYLDRYAADRNNLSADYYNMYPSVISTCVKGLEEGDTAITRGELMEALPGAARIQLVLADGRQYAELRGSGTVSETWAESQHPEERETPSGPQLILTDTATLATLSDQNYTVIRDYGDVYWTIRMAINDATNGYSTEFSLPTAE